MTGPERSWAQRCALGAGLASTALAGAGLLSRRYRGTRQAAIVLSCFAPHLPAAAIAGSVLSALGRSRGGAATACLIGSALVAEQAPRYVPRRGVPAHGRQVVVLTANLLRGSADPHALVELVRSNGVDVLALQELTPGAVQRLSAAGLQDVLPHANAWPAEMGRGTGLWSRYPMSCQRRHAGFEFHQVSAVLHIAPGRTLTAFSTHLAPPWPRAPRGWRDELRALPALVRSTGGPLVDAGDFNATLDQGQFRAFLADAGLLDAADQAGAGPVRTYPADRAVLPPLIGIDHVLVRQVVTRSVSTVSLPGSDHRGLSATLIID